MRAYERERVEWLGRRREAPREGPRLVDRTGQPPVWELPRTAGGRS
jgi:hypothetical protein